MGFLLAVGWGAGQPAFHASAQRLIKRQSIILERLNVGRVGGVVASRMGCSDWVSYAGKTR